MQEQALYSAIQSVYGTLTQEQRTNIAHIWNAWVLYGNGNRAVFAYLLATCQNENHFRNIQEVKSESNTANWKDHQSKYWKTGFYGRGFGQVTWEANYQKWSDITGLDLVSNPDLILSDPALSARILVEGGMLGVFTSRKLTTYFTATKNDPWNARRVYNGIKESVNKKIVAWWEEYYAALAPIWGDAETLPTSDYSEINFGNMLKAATWSGGWSSYSVLKKVFFVMLILLLLAGIGLAVKLKYYT
jgi:hypothetical protein